MTFHRRVGAVAFAASFLVLAAGCGGGGDGAWSEDECVEHVREVVIEASSSEPEARAQRLQDLQKELADHSCPQGADGTTPEGG